MIKTMSSQFRSIHKNYENTFVSNISHFDGFLLIEQYDQSWLIRPTKSPLRLLPFWTEICSLKEAKQILKNKLLETEETYLAA